jgi:hypothetical protein
MWPPYGPDIGDAHSNKIPAQVRYEQMQECRPMTSSECMQSINSWRTGTMNTVQMLSTIKQWKQGCA